LVKKQAPLSLTTVLLLTFSSVEFCHEGIKLLGKDVFECVDHSRTYTYTDQIPNVHAKLENPYLQLHLDANDGSLKVMLNKKEDVRVNLRQRFMAYDGKL
jgi:hypothetical protein